MLLDPARVAELVRWDGDVVHVGEHPVYVDFTDSILDRDTVLGSRAASVVPRSAGLLGRLRRRVRSLTAPDAVVRANVERLVGELRADTPTPTVLVVGGGEIGIGTDALYTDARVGVVAFDIYASPTVQFIADGHRIPLRDGCVDGVVVQAVLEHVLDPGRVVAEIHRVLRPDGVVYADTPFLQHVHEGAYDFTRFTESGHRWLFRGFRRIDSGVNGGLGVQAIWTAAALVGGLLRSRTAGRVTRLALFWLRYLDALVPQAHHVDGAAGVWFLGRRADSELAPSAMPGEYRGAQR